MKRIVITLCAAALMIAQTSMQAGSRAPLNKKLITAAQQGDWNTVKQAISDGANVNQQDKLGNTAYDYAEAARNKAMVQYLIKNGANKGISYKREGSSIAAD